MGIWFSGCYYCCPKIIQRQPEKRFGAFQAAISFKEHMIKKAIIPALFALILLAADTTFMTFVEYLGEYGELDFTHSMFIFGVILGGIYLLLEIVAALYRAKFAHKAQNWLAVLPNIFVPNGFYGISMFLLAKFYPTTKKTAIISKP